MTIAKQPVLASFAVMLGALFFATAASTPAAAFSFGKKKAPVAVAPPPEPEIAVGPPALASYVIDAASAYASYMRTTSGIGSQFADGPSVMTAVRLGVHSEHHQLQQGEIAYAAIVALQDPTFVAAVRGFGKHASTRDEVVRDILANPAYVMSLDGHESAAGLIQATLHGQGDRLRAAGQLVRQASYDIQLKAAWSKKPAANQSDLLSDAKTLSATGIDAAPDMRASLLQASTGRGGPGPRQRAAGQAALHRRGGARHGPGGAGRARTGRRRPPRLRHPAPDQRRRRLLLQHVEAEPLPVPLGGQALL
ncbi:MAG: hypothetical protein WDM92_11895 [Caulobacteraceae bacterium]